MSIDPKLVERTQELSSRKGGKGPHMDRSNATLSQLASWAEQAADNISHCLKNSSNASAFLGGWEDGLLRDLAKEMRSIASVLPDPDDTAARELVAREYPLASAHNEPALIRMAWLGIRHGKGQRE